MTWHPTQSRDSQAKGASREKTTHSSLKCPVRYFLTWNISKIFAGLWACHHRAQTRNASFVYRKELTIVRILFCFYCFEVPGWCCGVFLLSTCILDSRNLLLILHTLSSECQNIPPWSVMPHYEAVDNLWELFAHQHFPSLRLDPGATQSYAEYFLWLGSGMRLFVCQGKYLMSSSATSMSSRWLWCYDVTSLWRRKY